MSVAELQRAVERGSFAPVAREQDGGTAGEGSVSRTRTAGVNRDAARGLRVAGWTTLAGGLFHAAIFIAAALMLSGLAPALKFLDEQHWLAHLLEVPGMSLLATGLFGIYRFRRGELGRLGRVGAYVAAGGLGAAAVAGLFIAVVEPTTGLNARDGIWLPLTHAPGLVGIVLGSLILGAAIARSRALPRRLAVTVLAAIALFVAGSFVPLGDGWFMALPALISLAWASVGYSLATHGGETSLAARGRTQLA